MRRSAPWVLAIGASLVLLTFLLARSLDSGQAQYARLAGTLRELSGSEVATQRNVLRARAGLLRNYDPLVRTMDAARANAAALQDGSPASTELQALAREIGRSVAAQEELVEQFKTSNALLQNSSAFFDQLATHLMADGQDAPLTLASGTLAAAMLQLTHESSPESLAAVEARLSAVTELANRSQDRQQAADAAVLVQHGRMLSQLVAAVDTSVRTLLGSSSEAGQAAFLAQLEHDRTAGAHAAERFRVALYAAALLLLVLLAGLGVQLRARAQALRHRSETERLIAKFSARLIGCAPEETDTVLAETIAVLGPAFAADRCYLVRPGSPAVCQLWQARGVPGQPGWPEVAIDLAGPATLNHVVAVSRLPAGGLRDGLEAARVGSWVGASVRHGDALIGLIGFDRMRSGGRWPPGGLGLLSLATEVVASALRRQRVLLERADLELRLSRARRLEAVGTFASGIAHNFNNVVGAIMGHAEMAGDGLPEDGPRARHVDEIRRAGERARELVAHILDYGSRGSQARTPVVVDTLLAETVSLLRASAAATLDLRVLDDPESNVVAGEAGQLQQVFLNLIRNAAQASGAGTTIAIETSAVPVAASSQLSHGEIAAGPYVRISVTDAGPGMDAATLRRLFQPFFTTRPGGTGLGLATAWEIVRDHDGALDVRSTPGEGTTFHVWLPALRPDAGPGRPARASGDRTVMVLNPDETSRYRDEEVVAALGYEPVGYDRAEAAWAACHAEPDRFAALILDRAAAFNGAGPAAGLLQLAGEGRPIIILGSEACDMGPAELAGLGIVEVIARPVRSGALATALARWR